MPGRLKDRHWILFFFLWGLLIYSNAFSAGFQFDDSITIVNNPVIKNFDFNLIWRAFNTRFLTGLTFALNYAVGGLNVTGYHVVNIALHLINAILVFIFVRLLSQTPGGGNTPGLDFQKISVGAALIFLSHPIQTQAVIYITQRASCLAAFFYLTTIIFYLYGRLKQKTGFYLASGIAMLFGSLSKEMIVTVPLILVLLEICFLKSESENWSARAQRLVPFFVLAAVVPLSLRLEQANSILGLKGQLVSVHFRWPNFWTEINVIRTYLRLTLWPAGQNLDYDYPLAQSGWDPGTIFSFLLVIFLIATAVRQWRWNRLISFCILWFFLTMSVELTACTLIAQDMIFEHYLYLPMVGFAILAAWGISQIMKSPRVYWTTIASTVLILGVLTHQRNNIWQGPLTLWQDVAKKSPAKPRAYINLGVAYRREGQFDKAIESYQRALSLNPPDPELKAQIYVNLGAVYGRQKNYKKEIELCRKAIQLNPLNVQAFSNLGYAYLLTNNYAQALVVSRQAVELNPDFAEANHNLGIVYATLAEFPLAVKYLRRALVLDPDNGSTKTNLQLALRMMAQKIGPDNLPP